MLQRFTVLLKNPLPNWSSPSAKHWPGNYRGAGKGLDCKGFRSYSLMSIGSSMEIKEYVRYIHRPSPEKRHNMFRLITYSPRFSSMRNDQTHGIVSLSLHQIIEGDFRIQVVDGVPCHVRWMRCICSVKNVYSFCTSPDCDNGENTEKLKSKRDLVCPSST